MTKPVTFLEGQVQLYLGDCREILPTLGRVDAVVTDPPYGIGFKHSGRGAPPPGRDVRSRHSERITGDNEPFDPALLLSFPNVLIWGANHFAARMPEGRGRWLVWDKLDDMESFDSFSDAEFAWHSLGRATRIFKYKWKGVFCRKAGEENGVRHHPSMKPLALMRWCIQQVGDGQTILDPYMGSGSTGVASINLGRRFIGIEIEPKYFDIACRRIEEATKQADLFIERPAAPKQEALDLTPSGGAP